MPTSAEHEHIREVQDRGWTFRLLTEVRAESTPETDRSDAFQSLRWVEDYRAIGPLTRMVEDRQLPEELRKSASVAVRGFDDTTTEELRRGWWASDDLLLMTHALGLMERSEADIVATVAGDNSHPLQAQAIHGMAFGFDAPEFPPILIQALGHADPAVRGCAADVLIWDEPVLAEAPLIEALKDISVDVAISAAEALQYYPSQRVLITLSEMLDVPDDQLRSRVAASFDSLRSDFLNAVTNGPTDEVNWLREKLKGVDVLISSPDEPPPGDHLETRRPVEGILLSSEEVLRLSSDVDGDWAPIREQLRRVNWPAMDAAERLALARKLVANEDPGVREIAADALAAADQAEELVVLAGDRHALVRQAAVAGLGRATPRTDLADFAWSYLLRANGQAADEALDVYVVHAPSAEAKERLVALARNGPSESLKHRAMSNLLELKATAELTSLLPLLDDPPEISWALHIQLLNAMRKLGLPARDLRELALVDDLRLLQAIAAVPVELR